MMNRRTGAIVGSILLLVLAGLIYWIMTNSLSYHLRAIGFSKENIVHEEGYSFSDSSDRLTKVMLLADKDRLALIVLERKAIWGWERPSTVSVAEHPKDGQYVLAAAGSMKLSWGKFYTENHVFAARYVDAWTLDINAGADPPVITGMDQMYLNVSYFSVHDRTLLFAHAISGKGSKGVYSGSVTEHIDAQLGAFAE
ncbi:hypothetical protein [Paenibacillus soyae]|uniref:Uncharacterized protein n=1 Tax=Paenibacillus soyae TaxID=2969249 RepID=A0A9X2SAG6_9BACL|nr:hypothetical protein [Paenibacillus soyae]MCR2806659.1 hypothetical protein [Paenibacillus soyae]